MDSDRKKQNIECYHLFTTKLALADIALLNYIKVSHHYLQLNLANVSHPVFTLENNSHTSQIIAYMTLDSYLFCAFS